MALRTTIGASRLSSNDFTVDSPVLIGLNHSEWTVILFHTQNDDSINMARIWYRIAAHTVGPRFGICDVLAATDLFKTFQHLRADESHPFYPYSQHAWPVILAYRNGFPVAMYKSSHLTQEHITFWALST